jgi:hypothetical protein
MRFIVYMYNRHTTLSSEICTPAENNLRMHPSKAKNGNRK